MSERGNTLGELAALLDAVCEGRATAEQHAALHERMRSDASAVAAYADYMALHGDLQWRMREPTAQAAPALRPMDEADRGAATALIDPMPLRTPMRMARRSPLRWAMAAAALVAIGGALVGLYVTQMGDGADGEPTKRRVAVLVGSDDVTWTTPPIESGQIVRSGVIGLASGRIELQLTNDVMLELTGPAELELRSDLAVELRFGRLWAHATPSFEVRTPRFSVIDLGTEFGVTVEGDGSGQVHVIEGSAEVRGASGRVLSTGEAWSIGSDGSGRSIAYDPSPYVRTAWPTGRAAGYVRYGFDEGEGAAALDGGSGVDGGPFHAELSWAKPGTGGAARVEGRFGGALVFDGVNDVVRTGYRGVGGKGPRTVAMWVRVPADATSGQANAMLTYGSRNPGAIWQMSWNAYKGDGAYGALRVGVLGDQIVGKTDLRDGEWHHVAATFDGARARLYVDGALDAERDMRATIDTATDAGAGAATVQMGQALGDTAGGATHFRGTLDEVWLFEAALSEAQVRRLAESNEGPGR